MKKQVKKIIKEFKELTTDIIALIIAIYIGLAPISVSLTGIIIAGLVF